MPVSLSIPIARARRGAVGAAVRLGQPLTKTSNLRGLASYPVRNGGASHLAQQKLLPRASCRHATSASQQGQVAGAEASEVSDERSTKEGENSNYRGNSNLSPSASNPFLDADSVGNRFDASDPRTVSEKPATPICTFGPIVPLLRFFWRFSAFSQLAPSSNSRKASSPML